MFFFFNDTATTEIYTLSLHDALPISRLCAVPRAEQTARRHRGRHRRGPGSPRESTRSEEHTSELQSPCNLVCRLLLEKKKKSVTQHSECHGSIQGPRRNAVAKGASAY